MLALLEFYNYSPSTNLMMAQPYTSSLVAVQRITKIGYRILLLARYVLCKE